jgi:hypothetical protein
VQRLGLSPLPVPVYHLALVDFLQSYDPYAKTLITLAFKSPGSFPLL